MQTANSFVVKDGVLIKYIRNDRNIDHLEIPDSVIQINPDAFLGVRAKSVRLPASVRTIEPCLFPRTPIIEVYDTIDPEAKPAANHCDSLNGTYNSPLGYIGIEIPKAYIQHACNGSWWEHTITVLSAADHTVKYKVRMPAGQKRKVYCTYASSWGRNAEFNFKAIEDIFKDLTADAKQDFVLDGLRYAVLSQSFRESLGGYVKKNALALCGAAIQNDDLQLLQTLEEYSVIKNLNSDQLLELADQHNSVVCKAWLLDKISTQIKPCASMLKEPTVAEIKRIWSYKQESEEGLTITGYRGIDINVVVPEKIGKQTVIAIAEDCFSINRDAETQQFLRTKLRSVTIPDTVKEIGCWAFAYCEALESVHLPANLTKINDGLFRGCKNLNIEIPEGIIRIGGNAFTGCPMDIVHIPATVSWIVSSAFGDGQQDMRNPKAPNIGMPNLEAFSIDKGNKSYCVIDGVLFSADKKTLIRYPQAKKDESYTVPASVKAITFHAFACATYLKHLELTTVKEVERDAFCFCGELESIVFPDGIKNMSSRFVKCCSLKKIVLPDNLKELQDNMFFGCTTLKNVVLPATLKKIGRGAFAACKELTELEIPSSVKSVGYNAFYLCEALQSLYVNSADTKVEFCDFSRTRNLTIYAPAGSKIEAVAKTYGIPVVERT